MKLELKPDQSKYDPAVRALTECSVLEQQRFVQRWSVYCVQAVSCCNKMCGLGGICPGLVRMTGVCYLRYPWLAIRCFRTRQENQLHRKAW